MSTRVLWLAAAILTGGDLGSPEPGQGRQDERQAICQGPGARSWTHMLGTTCLADLILRGIVKTQKGYKAMLESEVTRATFTAEPGALLYDGVVTAIDDNSVTIRQTVGIPARAWQASGSDGKQTRLVTRRLRESGKNGKP